MFSFEFLTICFGILFLFLLACGIYNDVVDSIQYHKAIKEKEKQNMLKLLEVKHEQDKPKVSSSKRSL